ncbi:hypothetical protein GCK32_006822 [Trichostrongylus colubriformis]|uniref:Hydroxysteroid dehydrogenase-like protein 2 n=1 Tax=Trichostrongylus colubriformis TaxID=6319 RepID=A0AAN8EXF7_TRICO
MHRSLTNLPRTSRAFSRFLSSSSSKNSELEVQQDSPHVYHVKLNRPDRRNTFTMELWKEMKSTFDRLAEEPECRAIVLSGNGKSFCAGIDLQQGMGELVSIVMNDDIDVGRKGRILRRIITTCQDGFTAIEVLVDGLVRRFCILIIAKRAFFKPLPFKMCSKPVIAAIHSHCVGAGIDLITACDIRYASSDVMFSIREVDIGMAADVGTLNRLQKIVGNDSWTRELAFTARNFGADEALKFGLISRIFNTESEVVEGALALAKRIAEKSPIGVQGTKEVLNHARDHTILESLDFVKTWNMSQLQSTDLRNGAMAAMNKQKPVFENFACFNMFNTGKFFGRTVVITGASRGIGKEIALKLAKDGANVVIAAKTATAHAKLPGTIYTAAEEVEKAGGKALPCVVDVRDEASVRAAVESAVKKFGGIDILINNASAISLTNTEDTEMKRYDLMHSINTRGTFLMSKTCLPYLKQGKNPHILNISPPLLMEPRWFSNHADIMADAAYAMLSKNSREYTGNFAIDEEVLRAEGVVDFTKYAVDPGAPLTADFFIPSAENFPETFSMSRERQLSAAIDEDVANVLKDMGNKLSKDLVDKLGAVFEFTLTGDKERKIVIDLKNGNGSIAEKGDDKADVK